MISKTGTKTIETCRLILRRYRVEDAEDMFRNWASDPEVTRFLTWPPHKDAGISRMLLQDWVSRYADGGFFNWAIEWKENGQVVGNIAVVRLEEATETAEIGYCLGRGYWGRGIMPEALRAVRDYLFWTVGCSRISADHDANNPKSGRVMEKAGMKREGLRRMAGKNNQGICDVVNYGLLRSDMHPEEKRDAAQAAVRFAREEDLERINILRRQVNDLHVLGKPEVFKPGFCSELRDYIYVIWNDPEKKIVAAEKDGTVCGFAVLSHIVRPETPFMYVRDYLDIDEFGVDRACRRQGIALAMIRFIRSYAKEKGFSRIELNMWEFNRDALAFYEAAGFAVYRRYMEMKL